MKSFFHKLIAVTLAFMVLGSTASFAVNLHYCGNHLVDVSFFNATASCGMELKTPSPTTACDITKTNCCTNKHLMVSGQQELKQTVNTPTFQQQFIAAAFVYTYLNLFEGLDQHIVPFKDYSPPLLVRDIQVLDETYLI